MHRSTVLRDKDRVLDCLLKGELSISSLDEFAEEAKRTGTPAITLALVTRIGQYREAVECLARIETELEGTSLDAAKSRAETTLQRFLLETLGVPDGSFNVFFSLDQLLMYMRPLQKGEVESLVEGLYRLLSHRFAHSGNTAQ